VHTPHSRTPDLLDTPTPGHRSHASHHQLRHDPIPHVRWGCLVRVDPHRADAGLAAGTHNAQRPGATRGRP
jgi:hypothetical protein